MEQKLTFKFSEMEPYCVLRLLLRKLWVIILAALIGVMGMSVALNALVSKSYSSSVIFSVTSRAYGQYTYNNVAMAEEVAKIYTSLLTSAYMKDTITEDIGDVSGTISASQLGKTNLLKVTATSESPKDALKLIQAVVDHQGELSEYVSSTAALHPVDAVNVNVSVSGVYNVPKMCALAGIACAVVMAAALVFLYAAELTVQTRSGAKSNLDGKLLTQIPHEAPPMRRGLRRIKRNSLLVTEPTVSFGFTEAINRLAAHLEKEHTAGRKVFLFTSTRESEGKSTLTANTALSLASKSARVLLIDLDLRRPVQHRILNETVPPQAELGSILSDGTMLAEQVLDIAIERPGSELSMLLSSKENFGGVRALSGSLLKQVIDLARKRYDYVIIDTPPQAYFADSQVLSDLADAAVLVVRQDVATAPQINDTMDALRSGKCEFLGYVLNDMRHLLDRMSDYGYAHGSYYYGKYGRYGKYGHYGHYGKYGAYSQYAKGHGKYEKSSDKTGK